MYFVTSKTAHMIPVIVISHQLNAGTMDASHSLQILPGNASLFSFGIWPSLQEMEAGKIVRNTLWCLIMSCIKINLLLTLC